MIRAKVFLKIAETEQLYQANDWRNREHVVLDKFLKCVRSKGFFGEPLGSSDSLTWANFGNQKLAMTPSLFPVCPSKSPCVRPKRLRVAGIHGDALNVHTGFSACHTTPHTHHDHNDTHNTTQHHTQHHTETGTERRQRKETKERERREDGRGETRQDKTRQDKRRQEKTREEKRRDER